jgi:hypothetical protein
LQTFATRSQLAPTSPSVTATQVYVGEGAVVSFVVQTALISQLAEPQTSPNFATGAQVPHVYGSTGPPGAIITVPWHQPL